MINMKEGLDDFINSYYAGMNKLTGITMEDFVKYYNESKYSGYPHEPGGSVWESEGKFIYVLIRHLKPRTVLEIGNYMGRGSTNHILQAIDDNGMGEVTLLDIMERLEYDRLHSRKFNRVLEDSLKFLEQPLSFDLIVQDGCHEYEHVSKELQLIAKNSIQETILWGHDYYTIRPPDCEVQRAWIDNISFFSDVTPMKDSISNCGLVVAKFKKK